jgi:PTS system nitrogen regulatory IIA component
MNQLAPLLNPERVLLDVEVTSKPQLFEYVAQRMSPALDIHTKVIVEALLAREKLGSTGLGQGVAIPHGRLKTLQIAAGVLVRLRDAVNFDAPDQLPVRLLFVLFVPSRATDLHLQILSEVAQLFGDKVMRGKLLNSDNPEQILTLLHHWQAWSE